MVVVPLKSEMALRRRRTDHFAIVGFRDESEAHAWHPGEKAEHLQLVGPFSRLSAPACDIGCCR